jgi:predicted permease
VIIDLAACVFVFGVYLGMIQLVDQNIPFSIKKLCINALKTPSFITLVLGLICGITGIMERFLDTSAATVYVSVKDMIVAPISPMILICVGYSLSFNKELIPDVLKTVLVRFIVQMSLMAVTLLIMKNFSLDKYMLAAFLVYFMSTPNFNPGTVVKDEKGGQYIATTTSLYCLITIIGYIIIAGLLF